VTERELQALLDARPGAATDRVLAALSPEERREARRWLALARAAGALPAATPSPGFVERTAARLARLDPPRRRGPALVRRLSRWIPACAAAAAGILAVAVPRLSPPPAEDGGAIAHLSLAAPGAREVRAAGDFNRWRPEATPLRRDADGVWRAEVAVPPGRGGAYLFVVDGAWVLDPAAPDRVEDGFGGENALLRR
jgi:hypothetical protein